MLSTASSMLSRSLVRRSAGSMMTRRTLFAFHPVNLQSSPNPGILPFIGIAGLVVLISGVATESVIVINHGDLRASDIMVRHLLELELSEHEIFE